MPIRSIPSTLPTGTRRKVPYGRQAGACDLKVELLTNPEGEVKNGILRIPERLAHAEKHTNQWLERKRMFEDQIQQWDALRAKHGWARVTVPQIKGPTDPPTEYPGAPRKPEDVDMVWFIAFARFRRTERLWRGLDSVLEMNRLAEVFKEAPPRELLPWDTSTEGNEETDWVDPMKEAQEWFARYGIKREDYLFGPLDKPLSRERRAR